MFVLTLRCGASKDFMKALKVLKAFIKSFEAPQRMVGKKLILIFFLRSGSGQEGLK